ncbi:MAG: hypothetical protein Q8N59_01330 [bacterium]|nr:hypothetical protein [bacterium]
MNEVVKEAIAGSIGPFVVLLLAIPHLILRILGLKGFFFIVHTHESGDPTDAFIFHPRKEILKKKTK